MSTHTINQKSPELIARGTNRRFQHSVTVKAPADRVWAVWMDVKNWPSWDPLLVASSSSEPLSLGVEGQVVPKKGLPSKFTIVCFEPQTRWALEASLIIAKLTVTRSLTTQGDFTTFTHAVEFSGFAAAVFARFLGPDFRAALPDVMQKLAEQATHANK
jgi:Polyketide cyclase / dehydrase and lipid transport